MAYDGTYVGPRDSDYRDSPYGYNSATVSASVSLKNSDGENEWTINFIQTFSRVKAPTFGDCNDTNKSHAAPELKYGQFSVFSPCCNFGYTTFSHGRVPTESIFTEDENGDVVEIDADTQRRNLSVKCGSIKRGDKTYTLIGLASWDASSSWIRPSQPTPKAGPYVNPKDLFPFNYGAIPSFPTATIQVKDVTREKQGLRDMPETKAVSNTEQIIYFAGGGENDLYGGVSISYDITVVPGSEDGIIPGSNTVNFINGATFGAGAFANLSWVDPDRNYWEFLMSAGVEGSGGSITKVPVWPLWVSEKEYKEYDIVNYYLPKNKPAKDADGNDTNGRLYQALNDVAIPKSGESNKNPELDLYDSVTNPEGNWKEITNYDDHIQITSILHGIRIGFIGKYAKAESINKINVKPFKDGTDEAGHTSSTKPLVLSVSPSYNYSSFNISTEYFVPEEHISEDESGVPGGYTIDEFWSSGPSIFAINSDSGTYNNQEGNLSSNYIFTQSIEDYPEDFEITPVPEGNGGVQINGRF